GPAGIAARRPAVSHGGQCTHRCPPERGRRRALPRRARPGGIRSGRPAVPALIHASLWDEEPAVRLGAAVALWKIDHKGPLVLDVLIRALGDANELICWIAAECLGQMGSAAREAVPVLRQALGRDFRVSLIKTGVRLALEHIEPRTPPSDAPHRRAK